MKEMPSDSLAFSLFELLYVRQSRQPLSIIQNLWTNATFSTETQSSYKFVLDLRDRLSETAEIVSKKSDFGN